MGFRALRVFKGLRAGLIYWFRMLRGLGAWIRGWI